MMTFFAIFALLSAADDCPRLLPSPSLDEASCVFFFSFSSFSLPLPFRSLLLKPTTDSAATESAADCSSTE